MSALDDMEERNEKAAYERGYSDGAAQAREDVLEKSIKVIQNRIDCIMMSYDGEKNEAITQRPYAMADGMQECILMLKSLRTGGDE